MTEYKGPERRKHPRIYGNFVVSYKILDKDKADLSQTRNISEGGMLLTTNRVFPKGTLLDMSIRLPFIDEKINVIGEVLESEEKVKGLIYETRIAFRQASSESQEAIGKSVEMFKKERGL